jgi:hypothetical protein
MLDSGYGTPLGFDQGKTELRTSDGTWNERTTRIRIRTGCLCIGMPILTLPARSSTIQTQVAWEARRIPSETKRSGSDSDDPQGLTGGGVSRFYIPNWVGISQPSMDASKHPPTQFFILQNESPTTYISWLLVRGHYQLTSKSAN